MGGINGGMEIQKPCGEEVKFFHGDGPHGDSDLIYFFLGLFLTYRP